MAFRVLNLDVKRKSFSMCGIVNSAKRNWMEGNAVAAQVFLYNNSDALDLPLSELFDHVQLRVNDH